MSHSSSTSPIHSQTVQVTAQPALTMAQAVYTLGTVEPPALCSALGVCGKCRMRFLHAPPAPHEADLKFFTTEELESGWRLGCRHQCLQDTEVELPVLQSQRKKKPSKRLDHSGPFMLAVDLGTTSLHWQLLAKEDGESTSRVLASGSELNPQMGAGSEVMSRLAFAKTPEGLRTMQQVTCSRLRAIIDEICGDVTELCIAGNSVMSYILLGKPVDGLASAPYMLPYSGGTTEYLPDLPPMYIPPIPAPFVGADLSAGYAAVVAGRALAATKNIATEDQHTSPNTSGSASTSCNTGDTNNTGYANDADSTNSEGRTPNAGSANSAHGAEGTSSKFPFMLADLGTNGEFILALSPDKALITSVALGPALEGIGLTFGTVAQRGAITGFTLTPMGLEPKILGGNAAPVHTPHNGCACPSCQAFEYDRNGTALSTPPQSTAGISGTGYLSLLHQLKKCGLLQEDGRFATPPYPPLTARLAKCLSATDKKTKVDSTGGREEQRLALTDSMYLSASDIEEILKVKAAFSLAFEKLLKKANLQAKDLTHLYLAGALGEHAPVADLEGLGFIPQGLGSKVTTIGNSSLKGAAHFLVDPKSRNMAERWTANTKAVDLTADSQFTHNFMRHMRFTFI